MYIAGLNGFKYVGISDLCYYYQVNNYLVFVTTGGVISLSFTDYFSARDTADQFFEIYYKQLITIPRYDGRCYVINVALVTDHTVTGLKLNVEFSDKNLEIRCINAAHAVMHDLYIEKVSGGYNFIENFSGTKKYVNGNGLEDYTTVTAALAAYTPGECIVVRPGTYTDDEIFIPDELILYAESGALFTGTWNLNLYRVFHIYGYGSWEKNGTPFASDHNAPAPLRPVSYLEFYNLEGSSRTLLSPQMIIKGYSFSKHPSGAVGTLIDTDASVRFDCDIVKAAGEGTDLVYIQYIETSGGYCNLRNGRYTNDGGAGLIIAESAHSTYEYNLINARLHNANSSPDSAIINCYSNTAIQTFNLFNCIMESGSAQMIYSIDQYEVVNLYGKSYSNVAGAGGSGNQLDFNNNLLQVNPVFAIGEELDQNTNLNYTIMPLTNMPTTAHYKTGQNAFVWIDNNLVQGVISKVISEVSNPANDSSGVQRNIYEFVQFSGSFPESKVFASPRHALSTKKGSYLLTIDSADESIQGFLIMPAFSPLAGGAAIPDISGSEFINCDFSNPGLLSFFDGAITDNISLAGTTLHGDIDTKAEFKAFVGSYDPVTTIWTDGNPIG